MVSELVDQDVVGERSVRGDRRLVVVNAASTVLGIVEQNDQVIVGGARGGVPDTAIVGGQELSFAVPCVVFAAQR